MYVDVLSGAMDAWDTDLSGSALLEYVVACRLAFLAPGVERADNACGSLPAAIAYDRALIALCSDLGIFASAGDFVDPGAGRTRLEAMLRDSAGVDLVSLSRSRAADVGHGSVNFLH
jgi:hypothetical protein